MKMETPEQTILYLQADIAKITAEVNRLKTILDLNLEKYGVNLKHLASKLGCELLQKRPCESCNGRGMIEGQKPERDPRLDEAGSMDCTGNVSNVIPSTPCTACDTIGIVWK